MGVLARTAGFLKLVHALTANPTLTETSKEVLSVEAFRGLSACALKRMFQRDRGMFAFHNRKGGGGVFAQGLSVRYTAIALSGLIAVGKQVTREVLGGMKTEEVSAMLLKEVAAETNLGNVALMLWLARALGLRGARYQGKAI